MRYLVMLWAVLVAVFLVLFLGGLASAWFESKRERAAGLPVSRPADELRVKRRARGGGPLSGVAIWWRQVRTGIPQCWCGHGTLMWFDGVGNPDSGLWDCVSGYGCTAVESGWWEAVRIHDAAGGYSRSQTGHVGVRTS